MAVLMAANAKGNVTFHDFLGISFEDSAAVLAKDSAEASASASVGAWSCAQGPVSNCSDLVSERRTGDHFQGVQLRSSMSNVSVAETSNRFSGRKRSNSDSGFMNSARDRMHLMGVNSAESSRQVKMFQNEMGGEQGRRNRDDRLSFSMLPPKRTSTSVILQQPIDGRPELVVSGQDCSLPMNAGRAVDCLSRFSQSASYMDKTSLKKYNDSTLAAANICVSQHAADEGSRTGKKDSSILHAISSAVPDRNAIGPSPSSGRPNVVQLNSGTESGNPPRRGFLTSISRQMTIFYSGQAHVFDDVHPNKVDEIIAMAGSSGGSWSTTYSPAISGVQQPNVKANASHRENEAGSHNMTFSQDMRSRLSPFQASYQGVSQGNHSSIPGDSLNL